MDLTISQLLRDAEVELRGSDWPDRLARMTPGLSADRLSMVIHPGDQMFLHSLETHHDVGAALSQYFAISAQQVSTVRQLIEALFGRTDGVRFLDFACGYGRLLRLLESVVPRGMTWASELQKDALEFVTTTFGVQGIMSCEDPCDFVPPEQFDFVWVASLFSHLPERLFQGWLAQLCRTLSPRGALCFSVRDVSQLPPDVPRPATGFLYATESENADLDSRIYGTAYASEYFVAAALAAAAPGCRWVRLPRALANEQDLYVVSRDPNANLEAALRFRRGPWGWVDIRRLEADGHLDLQGWAASLDDGRLRNVTITVGAHEQELQPTIERPDVAAAFADPRVTLSGWRYRLELAEALSRIHIEVTATDELGASTILYAGYVAR